MSRFIAAPLAAVILLFCVEHSVAQTTTGASPAAAPAAQADRIQPQGPTGPLNTTSGGAPAESPQGETPPGMQSAPQGSGASAPPRRSGQLEGTRE